MFVGHYAVALALKKFEKRASLGILFLAVQFVDILFMPFVMLGIERMNIVPDFTQSTHFELEYMPYTHSLFASALWAAFAYVFFRWIVVRDRSVALVVALAVFSHWILDLITHTPDLPLWSDQSIRMGLGLWNNAAATFAVEAILLVGALWLYLRATRASTTLGKYGMSVFVALLILMNVFNIYGPPPQGSRMEMIIMGLSAYFLFAAIAFWLDRKRV
jgi:membrane-bound metal-dependent hydrolase YbcI (DUF457 family)